MTNLTDVVIVPHTHWDREWYLPFQVFRVRLVEMIDRVLDQLEADERFRFTLDGQLATVDDYLRIRPEAEPRVRRLVADGRLAIGPWQVLLDQFLVSGETIVRDLRLGWERARELGGGMVVGYLPDMFGHVAQMPQILRKAGIERAVVWRGVPAVIDRHAFRWIAPDGSEVTAEYLPDGYGNGLHLLERPELTTERLEALEEQLGPFFGPDPLLAMYGADHSTPAADLMAQIDTFAATHQRWRLRVETLDDYLAAAVPADQVWRGELRSSARANQLMNVTSARIDIKVAMARAERALSRYAEPMGALWGRPGYEPFLDLAWHKVVASSAHDSICGCSIDPVMDQVLVRLGEGAQIAETVADRAVGAIAEGVAIGDVVVVNPSPVGRLDVVELRTSIPETWLSVAVVLPDGSRASAQELAREASVLLDETMPLDLVREFSLRIHGTELFGRYVRDWRIVAAEETGAGDGGDDRGGASGPRLEIDVVEDPDPGTFELSVLRRRLDAATARGTGPWRVVVRAAAVRRLVARVPAPALGWSGLRVAEGEGTLDEPVSVAARRLANSRLAVDVTEDGAIRVEAEGGGHGPVAGAGRLVDEGDFGDTYNWAPTAHEQPIVAPLESHVTVRERGPVRGVIEVRSVYRWPLAAAPDGTGRSSDTVDVPVTTELEMRAGEPFVRLRVMLENPCRDHRLRFVVALPRPAGHSSAEGQFAVVERGLTIEGGHGEVGQAAFPASAFLDAGGLAILLPQVTEYQLEEDGRSIGVTILRATGYLSRDANPYRRDPAGGQFEVPGAQCRGPWSLAFGLYPHTGSWVEADVVGEAERYRHPFLVAAGTGPAGGRLVAGEGLAIDGNGVILSALRRDGDWLELRVACERPEGGPFTIRGPFLEAYEADMLGNAGSQLAVQDGNVRLTIAPWEIRTLRLLAPRARA
jgi:mannosylglycerate hydrolase